MKRLLLCLFLVGIGGPAWAGGKPPYYGPIKKGGIGFKVGYEDRVEKDGSWRIGATTRGGGDAIDMALYRAAELARDAGYRYIFLLGGRWSKTPGLDVAVLFARPSHEAVAPIGCKSKKVTTCYTADAGEVMRILGGPGGTQPGVPIVDHRDEYGREVFLSGYGTGGVATLVPGAGIGSGITTIVDGKLQIRRLGRSVAARPAAAPPAMVLPAPALLPPPVPLAAAPMPVMMTAEASGSARVDAMERFDQARNAVKPIRGGSPTQGWTISD